MFIPEMDVILMKMDAQGFEFKVLEWMGGGGNCEKIYKMKAVGLRLINAKINNLWLSRLKKIEYLDLDVESWKLNQKEKINNDLDLISLKSDRNSNFPDKNSFANNH